MYISKKEEYKDPKQAKALLQGEEVTDKHWDQLITDSCRIYDQDTQQLILIFQKNAIPKAARDLAQQVFGDIHLRYNRPSLSRNTAAGKLSTDKFNTMMPRRDGLTVVGFEYQDDFRGRPILSNGKVLAELMCNPVLSFRAGYAENKRQGFAGPAGFTKDYPDEWQKSIPFFNAIDQQFKRLLPEIHTQHEERVKLHPWTTIPGTGLSSVAINKDYASHAHLDRGDFKPGWSTLTVVETPTYTGGLYVVLEYGLAIDIRDCDLVLSQSHVLLHGNVAIVKQTKDASRLSFVTYLSDRLADFDASGKLAHRRTGSGAKQQSLYDRKSSRSRRKSASGM